MQLGPQAIVNCAGYNNVDATADHRLTSYPQARRAYLDAFGG